MHKRTYASITNKLSIMGDNLVGDTMTMQQLAKAILEFLNDYQEENGDVSSGEIVGALEWAKLAHFMYARERKNESV